MPRPADGAEYFGLIICAALFICGSIVGTAAAGFVFDGNSGIPDYMARYLALAGEQSAPGFFLALFNACKYHLIVVFLGFSVFGVFCIPALSAVRGFFLCFSISAIVRYFGGDGVFLALAIFGVGAILTIPCLFVLSVQSFSSSLYVLRGMTAKGRAGALPPSGGGFFRRLCICAAVLAISALLDTLLIPRLISLAAVRIIIV